MEKNSTFNRLDYTFKALVVLSLGIAAAILARDIVIPLAFAALISIAVLPIVNRLEKKVGRVFSILIVLFATFLLLATVSYLVVNQMVGLVQNLPDLEQRFTLLLHDISLRLTRYLNFSSEEQLKLAKDLATSLSGFLTGFLVSTGNVVTIVIQIPIYVFLFLIYRDRFKDFFENFLTSPEQSGFKKQVEGVVQGYISGQLLVIAIIVTLDTVGLLLLGIDYAFFFGLLSGILVIIPYIGNFIGGSLPVIMALITKDSLWYAVGVVALYAIIHFIEGNIIAPRIMGSKVSVNALAAIVGLLIGGKILGIAGMILAVPALGVIKILLSYSNRLRPFLILLEDKESNQEDQPDDRVDEPPAPLP
jgi:predicted PurR-regulated permease PerM